MNRTIKKYLDRNNPFVCRALPSPNSDLGIIVVIPCYNEPDILNTLVSLNQCRYPDCSIEVIVSINASSQSSEVVKQQNLQSKKEVENYTFSNPKMKVLYIIHNDLSPKKAGVGQGRKLGLDTAAFRFLLLEKPEGTLVCLDADSKVEEDYLLAIQSYFARQDFASCSIQYAHPYEGNEYSKEIYDKIVQYELHLRYFIQMQAWAGLPYAFHTIGSSMACTMQAYCAIGGMNQRKAGEDFYFIQKLVKYGKHGNLNATQVIPSPRISDRVPFGTGKAVGDMVGEGRSAYFTYPLNGFLHMKALVAAIPSIYEKLELPNVIHDSLSSYLNEYIGQEKIKSIHKQSSSLQDFESMFWELFDAFHLMKYLHFLREKGVEDIKIEQALDAIHFLVGKSARERLDALRALDTKEGIIQITSL